VNRDNFSFKKIVVKFFLSILAKPTGEFLGREKILINFISNTEDRVGIIIKQIK
jgi:hypothetical protein